MSNFWGGGLLLNIIEDVIDGVVNLGRGGLGVFVFFVVGNGNGVVSYLVFYELVIVVVVMSMCEERKNFNFCDGEIWWGFDFGIGVDVVVFGVKIYIIDIFGLVGYIDGDYISSFNGIFFVCFNVVGVMVLVLLLDFSFLEVNVRMILESLCDKVGGYIYIDNVIG